MKKWKLTWIVMAVAVAVLALAGVALAATDAPSPAATPGAGVACGVTDDPEALAELQALRADFWEARQAWFDKYGADRTSDEAQDAFQKLRDDRIAKTQAVFDKYGIDATAGSRAGGGYGRGAMMGGGYGNGGMMGGGYGNGGDGRRLRGLRPQRHRLIGQAPSRREPVTPAGRAHEAHPAGVLVAQWVQDPASAFSVRTSSRILTPPRMTTTAMAAPITRSGMREPSSQTSTPATMTPMFAMTSLAEKIQDARMWMPPSRCLEMSARQVRFAASATSPMPTMRRLTGSLPTRSRRATSASDQQAERDLQDPAHGGGVRLQAPRTSDGRESDRVHEGVREHVERVGHQAGRLADPPGHCLDDEQGAVDAEQHQERAPLQLSRLVVLVLVSSHAPPAGVSLRRAAASLASPTRRHLRAGWSTGTCARLARPGADLLSQRLQVGEQVAPFGAGQLPLRHRRLQAAALGVEALR